MQYMLVIYNDPAKYQKMSDEDRDRLHNEYMVFTKELIDSGAMVDGNPLQSADTATTVRVRNGSTTTTDGPFAETKEVLGGYYIVECDDLDQAITMAAKVPDARTASVEVRPVMTLPVDADPRRA